MASHYIVSGEGEILSQAGAEINNKTLSLVEAGMRTICV